MPDPQTVAVRLGSLLDNAEPLQHAAGRVGKDAFELEASRSLGPDRSFSGLGRRAPLKSGYDLGNPLILNLYPKGLVILADQGRRRSKKISRRGRRDRRPYRIPGVGFRASFQSRPSRGARGGRLIDRTADRWAQDAPEAVSRALGDVITRGGF
jgi:hypothetical protein